MSRKDRKHDPEAAERVTSIIEAAERAAAALIDKADENAKRYLAEAEAEADRAAAARLQALNETADALISQAEAIRRESARLLESLRHADASGEGGSRPGMAGRQSTDSGLQGRSHLAPGSGRQEPASGQGRQEVAPGPGSQDLPEPAPAQDDGGSRGKHLAAVPGPSPAAVPDPWPGRGPDGGQPSSADGAPAQRQDAPPEVPPPGAAGPLPSRDAPVPPLATPGPLHPQAAPGQMPPQGDPHRSDGAAGARLLATQMAVSGYSRREIEAKLRRGFRIDDPTAILDAILGPGD